MLENTVPSHLPPSFFFQAPVGLVMHDYCGGGDFGVDIDQHICLWGLSEPAKHAKLSSFVSIKFKKKTAPLGPSDRASQNIQII